MDTARIDSQHPLGMHRNILRRILGRRSVRCGINTVDGEIALLLRPFPIVHLGAEGGHADGRRRHQTNVFVHFVKGEHIALTGPVGGADHLALAFEGLLVLVFDDSIDAAHGHRTFFHLERVAQGLHLVGDVQHLLQEVDAFALDGHLILAREGAEAILEVVVLRGAQGVKIPVGAVVVGDHQAVVRDHAAAAAEGQRDHGVAQRDVVLVIKDVRFEFEAGCSHLLVQFALDHIDKPHALVGGCGHGDSRQQQGGETELAEFHQLDCVKVKVAVTAGWAVRATVTV